MHLFTFTKVLYFLQYKNEMFMRVFSFEVRIKNVLKSTNDANVDK